MLHPGPDRADPAPPSVVTLVGGTITSPSSIATGTPSACAVERQRLDRAWWTGDRDHHNRTAFSLDPTIGAPRAGDRATRPARCSSDGGHGSAVDGRRRAAADPRPAGLGPRGRPVDVASGGGAALVPGAGRAPAPPVEVRRTALRPRRAREVEARAPRDEDRTVRQLAGHCHAIELVGGLRPRRAAAATDPRSAICRRSIERGELAVGLRATSRCRPRLGKPSGLQPLR